LVVFFSSWWTDEDREDCGEDGVRRDVSAIETVDGDS
jgi:hypothetical protein